MQQRLQIYIQARAKLGYNFAIAPVAPEIIPGRPPKIEVTTPQQTLHKDQLTEINRLLKQKPPSGIKARATVNPDKTSVL
jgi:hypothetical protein